MAKPSVKQEPQLETGDLVKVAGAQNQAEAEFVQALLADVGVPSMLRRTPGSDVADFLAAGPRDILVAAPKLQDARDALLLADLGALKPTSVPIDARRRVRTRLIAALALVATVAWCATELFT